MRRALVIAVCIIFLPVIVLWLPVLAVMKPERW